MSTLSRLALGACAVIGTTAGIALAAAPAATTTAATNVTATTATLNGTVSPNNTDTTYYFQYGTTAEYGTQTPAQGPVGGNANRSVSADVTGLAPSTTYHYRVVAVNADGTVNGADMTFATPAAGATSALTIASSKRTVTFGRPTVISGTLTGPGSAGVVVTLEENPAPYTGAYKSTGLTATTDAAGNYSITVSPSQNTRYRVTAGDRKSPTTSPEVTVQVRVRVSMRISDRTPAVGQRVWFTGSVLPAHDGEIARIQRRTASGRWQTVAKTALVAASPVGSTSRSTYKRRLRIHADGTYRVRVIPSDGDHIPGGSGSAAVVVH